MISSQTSKAFQVANLLCILFVISIHYRSGFSITDTASAINYHFQEFTLNGMARIAVPFFAFSSGLFLAISHIKKYSYPEILKRRFKTLVIPYLLTSLIIFLTVRLKEYIHSSHISLDLNDFVVNVLLHPIAGQLWFIRDLIVLVAVFPILFFAVRLAGGLAVLPLFILWFFELQIFPIISEIYLINVETLFFFTMGIYIVERRIDFLESALIQLKKRVHLLFLLWLVVIGARVYIDPTFNLWYMKHFTLVSLALQKASILLGLCAIVGFAHSKLGESKNLLYFSGFSFFVYLYHAEPLRMVLDRITALFSEPNYTFYIEYPLAVILVFSAAILTGRLAPALYTIITGDRGPNRKHRLAGP